MANDVTLPATGDVIATEEVAGREYQLVKIKWGGIGVVTDIDTATPLPVQIATPTTRTLLAQFASLNGDGTGTFNLIGDYSTPDVAYIQPGAGEVFYITRMMVYIKDGTGMSWDTYGGLAALSNGVEIKVMTGASTVVTDLTAGDPIVENADFKKYCYDADIDAQGGGDDLMTARWTFANYGTPLRLVGDNSDRIEIQLNDNMTGLVSQKFHFEGYTES